MANFNHPMDQQTLVRLEELAGSVPEPLQSDITEWYTDGDEEDGYHFDVFSKSIKPLEHLIDLVNRDFPELSWELEALEELDDDGAGFYISFFSEGDDD